MTSSNNPQPEHHKTIQDRWEDAQQRYNLPRALIERPDVPAKGKLLLTLAVVTTAGLVTLGLGRVESVVAYAAIILCSITSAFLTYYLPEPERGNRVRDGTSPP